MPVKMRAPGLAQLCTDVLSMLAYSFDLPSMNSSSICLATSSVKGFGGCFMKQAEADEQWASYSSVHCDLRASNAVYEDPRRIVSVNYSELSFDLNGRSRRTSPRSLVLWLLCGLRVPE